MQGFNVNISTAVKKLRGKIDFLQPLIEAISNSLEAHAKNIKIKLYLDNNPTLLEQGSRKVKSYEIEDDGEGFTYANCKSFSTYMSEHKVTLGCKGIGRLTWLKVFGQIDVSSYTQNSIVTFTFNKDFSDENIDIETIAIFEFLKYLNKNFFSAQFWQVFANFCYFSAIFEDFLCYFRPFSVFWAQLS